MSDYRTISKEELPIVGSEKYTHISAEVFYKKDGIRGYYALLIPVKHERGFSSCCPFDGVRYFLAGATRYNPSAAKHAKNLFEGIKAEAVRKMCEKHGFSLA